MALGYSDPRVKVGGQCGLHGDRGSSGSGSGDDGSGNSRKQRRRRAAPPPPLLTRLAPLSTFCRCRCTSATASSLCRWACLPAEPGYKGAGLGGAAALPGFGAGATAACSATDCERRDGWRLRGAAAPPPQLLSTAPLPAVVQDAEAGYYDLIVVDSSDPVGPAEVLFQKPFFEALHRALAPGGIVCTQARAGRRGLMRAGTLCGGWAFMRAHSRVCVRACGMNRIPALLHPLSSAGREPVVSSGDYQVAGSHVRRGVCGRRGAVRLHHHPHLPQARCRAALRCVRCLSVLFFRVEASWAQVWGGAWVRGCAGAPSLPSPAHQPWVCCCAVLCGISDPTQGSGR